MLNCLDANRVCTGAGCFRAFNERTHSFERYKNQDVQLMAFMRCNGCDSVPAKDAGILEKIERLETIGVETVHVGICTKDKEGNRCKNISAILDMLKEKGIDIIDGTH